jgi:hypothetical protein
MPSSGRDQSNQETGLSWIRQLRTGEGWLYLARPTRGFAGRPVASQQGPERAWRSSGVPTSPELSPSPWGPLSARVSGSRPLPAAPAARAGLRLLPAHPPRGAPADRWWAGPGRQAPTSRVCGSRASRSAGAVGPPGGVTPESSSRQGRREVNRAAEVEPPRLIGSPGRRRPGHRDPSARGRNLR